MVKDGHLLVTADGATVLNTLVEKRQENGERDAGSRQENGYVTNNPVVAFALQRATTLVNKAGDGSISLTLFLAHAVQRFQSATRSAGKRGRVVEGRELRSLALQLTRVKQTVLPRRILPGLHNLAQEFTNEVLVAGLGMSPREILLQLLSSHLSGTFPPHVCASLALMTMEWIGLKSDDGASVQPDEKTLFLDKVYTCVRAVEAKLPHCVVQVPGATLLSSTVLRGHYLLRRPIFGKPSRERLLVRAPCSFCIVLGHTVLSAGDGDGEDGGLALPISLITAGKEDVALAAACRRGHQRRVLDHLARAGINVVLYEEALDRGAAHEIERAGIVAIDLVEREELLHLAELAGIVPVGRSDVADLGFGGEMAAAMKLKAIGKASRARPLTLAGEPFFIFEGVGRLGGTAHEEEHRSSPAPSPPTAPSQLLLRAASASLCSHYYRSMRRCLRLVARWAQPEIKVQNRGLVLPGAAVTELCVSTWLHQCTIRKEEEVRKGEEKRGEERREKREREGGKEKDVSFTHLATNRLLPLRLLSWHCRQRRRPFPKRCSATRHAWARSNR